MRISDWSSDVCSSDLFTLKHPINAADRTTSDRNQGPEVANVRDLLRIRDLRISFVLPEGRLEAVRGVSFRVPAGKTVALVGESGSGKSVASQALTGILPRTAPIHPGRLPFHAPLLAAHRATTMSTLPRPAPPPTH